MAEVNSAIAVLGGLINTYLNLKQQHVVPVLENYLVNQKRFQTVGMSNPDHDAPAFIYLKQFYLPELHFDVSLERISFLAERDSSFVIVFSMARRSIGEVNNAFHKWNEVAEKCMALADEEDRFSFYFGLRNRQGVVNTYLPESISNLKQTVDDALSFTDKTLRSLQRAANKSLPFWLKKRINKFEIVDEKYQKLMPPASHKADWN